MRVIFTAIFLAGLSSAASAQQWGPQFGTTPNSAWNQPAPPPEQYQQRYQPPQSQQQSSPYQGYGTPSINPQSPDPYNPWNR